MEMLDNHLQIKDAQGVSESLSSLSKAGLKEPGNT